MVRTWQNQNTASILDRKNNPRVFFQCLLLPWLFGNVPIRADIFQLVSLFGAPVTRISKDECFFTVQKLVGLIEVVFVCRSCRETVRDAGAGINPDVSLHPEVPLIPFFSLVHLGIAFARFVLGGVGSFDDGGIDQ